MVEIGGYPILWHIMKSYSYYGYNDFIICCGYKGYLIKEYFANYFLHMSDVTFDMNSNQMKVHLKKTEPWQVTLLDTGQKTATGGRLKRIAQYLRSENEFCLTYGDGVADININELVNFHHSHGKLATVTAVSPPSRFGAIKLGKNNIIDEFQEKAEGHGTLINGGYFVLNPKVLDLISGDDVIWEKEPMSSLSNKGEFFAYVHKGFWQPMDTLREKNYLNMLWNSGNAPWRKW